MDNDYLNGYARFFGAIGTAIYVSLCRHADNETQKCFPAQETIAEELGIAVRTVRKYIAIFQKYQIISVSREKDLKTRRWINNVYTLLDKDHWVKPEAMVAHGARGNRQQKPEATDDKSHRQPLPHKETHREGDLFKETKRTDSISSDERERTLAKLKEMKQSLINKKVMADHKRRTEIQEEVGAMIRPSGKI